VEVDLLDWQHSRAQQFYARTAEHGSLQRFQSVDLAFGLAAAPRFGDGVPDGVDVAAQDPRELLEELDAGMARVIEPRAELAGVGTS
jgi:hypothetical protein